MDINFGQRFYTGLKKTGAIILALVLALDIGGSFFYARAASSKKTITYTPGAVSALTGSNASYEWRHINNLLDTNLSFNAQTKSFNSSNSAVLALTSAPDVVPEVIKEEQQIVEEEVVTPQPQVPQESSSGGGAQQQQKEDDIPVDEPKEDVTSSTPEVIEQEPEEDISTTNPEVAVEEDENVPMEEDRVLIEEEHAVEETPAEEEMIEEESVVAEVVEETPEPETSMSLVETPAPAQNDNTPAPQSESVETNALFGSLKTIALFASIGESLLPTKTLLASTTSEVETIVKEEPGTIPALVISDFVPDGDTEDLRFKAADLYISFTGDEVLGAKLVIEYGTGNTWTVAGILSFDTPLSNKTHGDYFKITLTDITTQEDIQNLNIRLTYVLPDGASIPLKSQEGFLFVDGLHLETTSEGQVLDGILPGIFPKEDLVETRTLEEQALARLNYANRIFELLKDGDSSEPFKILHKKYLEEAPLELALIGAASTSEAILNSEGKVVYQDIYIGTDFIYTPTETGLKEEILLKEPNHPDGFSYLLNLDNFDYVQTENNKIEVYQKGYEGNPLKKLYTISAPYMEDALGERSESLYFEIQGNIVTLTPDIEFLAKANYPIIIDPTVDIEVLTTYQHPLTGEDWVVDFATVGESDLYVRPRNQSTVDEIEFVSLTCDGEERVPDIQAGEVLYYPNWSCDGIGTVTHLINQEGGHILDFSFGGNENEVVMDTAFNGTVTWDGGGGDNDWSTCANWTSDACPTTNDDVVFDGTSTKNATLNVATTVRNVNINAGYTGTITQNATANLTLQNGTNFTQAAGTFQGGAASLIMQTGNITISGGTFTAPSTTSFFVNGGTGRTIDVNTTQTFESVSFTGGGSVTIASGDTLIVTGTTTLSNSNGINTGTLDARGDVVISGSTGAVGSSGILKLGSANTQHIIFQGQNAWGPILYLDESADGDDLLEFNGISEAGFSGIVSTAGFAGGTFRLNNATTGTILHFGTRDVTLSGGALSGGVETWQTYSTNITINSGATLNAPSSTVIYIPGGTGKTINVNTTQTFENLSITGDNTLNISSGDTLLVTGTTTISNGNGSDGGTIDARGDVIVTGSGGLPTNTTVLKLGSSGIQNVIFETQNTWLPNLTFDEADDALDIIKFGTGVSEAGVAGLTTTSGFSGEVFALNNATSGSVFNIGDSDMLIAGGTIYGGVETWEFNNANITVTNGNFSAPTTTLFTITGGTGKTIDVNTSQEFDNFTYSSGGAASTITSGDSIIITGTTTLANAFNTGTVEARGDVVVTSTNGGSATLLFTGSSTVGKLNQSLDLSGVVSNFNGDITINKSEGEVKLLSALDMDSSNQDLLLTSGTFNINGNDVTVDGTSGTFIVATSSTLKLQGGETVITNSGYPTFTSGSTVEYVGDEDGLADTYYLNNDWNYSNLTINFTDSNDGIDADTYVNGNAGVSPNDSLRSYWKFDNGTGTTATDEQGTTNGVLTNMEEGDWDSTNTATVDYTNDYSLYFDGSGEYVLVNDPTNLTAYTVSAWVRPIDTTSVMVWNRRINGNTGNQGSNHIRINSSGQFQHYLFDGALKTVTGSTSVVSGTWYHVAITSSNSGTMRLYVNGVEEGTALSVGSMWNAGNIYWIGSGSGGTEGPFTGNIDDVRLYNTVLSDTQIAEIADTGAPIEPETYLDIDNFTLSAGIFDAPSTTMKVAGDFANSGGTFTANSGTVSLTGTNQVISGDTTFYNLSKEVTSADTLTYGAGDRQTVTNSWTMTGTLGNVLTLQSMLGGTQWEIDPQNLYTVEYVTVSDSNNVNVSELSINESIVTSGGNNTNWSFNNLPTVASLGPSSYTNGSWGNDNTPTLSFTVADSDAENIRYHILIDDSSDFSSPIVNYTSGAQSVGATSFTIGQASGSGTYTTGNSGQTLSSGSYYWRASATDASGGAGATTTANSGAIAFKIDVTAPTAGTVSASLVTATTTTVTISGASDSGSGLTLTPYNFHDQTEDSYSGAISNTSYQFANLVPDTEYVFDTSVTDNASNVATTSSVTQRTLALVPTAPVVSIDSQTTLTFSWSGGTNPPTVTYYPVNITASTTPGWISAKTYQFTGLTCATTYQFEVKARNSDDVETATTTLVSATTDDCGSAEEEGGEGSSEVGGGSGGGNSGGGVPTITYEPVVYTPVNTTLETFTIISDTTQTLAESTVVSRNRVIYLTFDPPVGTQYVIIANNSNFEGGEYFEYSPDFAVQWNICQAADGTLLPDSQCARNLEYNVYIKFINYQGLESSVLEQRVFLYDPILPDEYFDLPTQEVIVDVLETKRVVTMVEFPFDDPFTDATGIRARNSFGEVLGNITPGFKESITSAPLPFVSAAEQYKQALKKSLNITFNVVGTITKYVTKVVNNPFAVIKDNKTINTYMDGFIEGFDKVRVSSTKVTLTRFEWLFGSSINSNTNSAGGSTGIGGGLHTDGPGTGGPLIAGTNNTNEAVRTVISGVAGGLEVTDEQVKGAATVAVVLAPGLLALQQALGFALFAGAFAWADLLWLILRWLHDLASFFHVRNKRRTWGYVYDAKTKMPLEPVLVELIDVETGRVIDRSVTDQTGQFGFIPRIGHFRIEARKSNYIFPSKNITGKTDGAYDHVYHGESFAITDMNKIIAPNIPMDEIRQDQSQLLKRLYVKLNLLEHNWGHRIATVVFWLGFLIVAANLMISLTALNIIIFGFYLVLVTYRYVKLGNRLWGHLENIPELPKDAEIVLELTHRKSAQTLLGRARAQSDGKFFLKTIAPGTYVLNVKVRDGSKEYLLLREDVAVGNDLVVNHDIYLG